MPQKLQVIKLKAVQTKRCKEIYGGQNVHDSHICTLTRVGEGACNGDSGGPLVLGNQVVGIVNFGGMYRNIHLKMETDFFLFKLLLTHCLVPCGLGYPDAYAKVSYLADWIDEHIETY